MNEVEEYFQYRVKIKPQMFLDPIGTNFITDVREVQYKPLDGSATPYGTSCIFSGSRSMPMRKKWEYPGL
jgi:hypothetical protein